MKCNVDFIVSDSGLFIKCSKEFFQGGYNIFKTNGIKRISIQLCAFWVMTPHQRSSGNNIRVTNPVKNSFLNFFFVLKVNSILNLPGIIRLNTQNLRNVRIHLSGRIFFESII